MGIWPCKPNNARFAISAIYLTVHMSFEYADLYHFADDFKHIVNNLTESVIFSIVILKMIILRLKNRQLMELIKAIREDFNEENYRTFTEKKVFLVYYERARTIVRTAVPLVVFTAYSSFLKPLGSLLIARKSNSTRKVKQ